MKQLKSVLSFLITVIFLSSLAVIPALAEGVISGDCNLFLPDEGTIKVNYKLLDLDGGTEISGAVYSLSGDGDVGSYAFIDPVSGELFIDSSAKGKQFTVSATAEGYSGSLVVNTSTECYCTDFEDETVGQKVANPIFSTKEALIVADENGNKAAESHTVPSTANWAVNPELVITPQNFASGFYTIEGRFYAKTGYSSVRPTQSRIVDIFYEGDDVNPLCIGVSTNTANNKLKVSYDNHLLSEWGNTDERYQYQYGSDTNYYLEEYVPFMLVVNKANNTCNFYIDGVKSFGVDRPIGVDSNLVTSIRFGTRIDDLKIYSGEKASGAFEVIGDSEICRAPEGTSSVFTYIAKAVLPWAGSADEIVWGLKEAHSGVSAAENGTVTVQGGAASGSFVLQAKTSDGAVLGEKTILIVDKLYNWADNAGRAYLDFNSYKAGKITSLTFDRTLGNAGWNDYIFRFQPGPGSGETYLGAPEIKTRSNGDKYVSARGRGHYSSTGATVKVYPSVANNSYALNGARCGTLEADFIAETENMLNYDFSLFTEMSTTNTQEKDTGFDIRYGKMGDNAIGIYTYMNAEGVGFQEAEKKLVAVVPADEWFHVRVEADFVDKVYDLYVNDRKVVSGAKHSMEQIRCPYIGAGVDNIAMYNGSKVTEEKGGLMLSVNGVPSQAGTGDKLVYSAAGSNTAALMYFEEGSSLPSGAQALIAQYKADGTLAGVTAVPITLSGGNALVCAALIVAESGEGDYAKAFLWDMDTLRPLK